jgi:hypothetical protein
MKIVSGVFQSRSAAERAAGQLDGIGIAKNKIHLLTPETSEQELAQVPTMTTEQPGVGKAIGATMGSAVGIAAGGSLGSLLIPGLGPILAVGLAGGALGAVGGGFAGGAVEDRATQGLPEDELFVYEDALRQGRTVVLAMAGDDTQADAVRGIFENENAESIDRARDMWWLGLRDVEKEKYEAQGGNFNEDERYFRCGFEAAQHSAHRGKSYEECRAQLGDRYPDAYKRKPFLRGFQRGRAYFDSLRTTAPRRSGK